MTLSPFSADTGMGVMEVEPERHGERNEILGDLVEAFLVEIDQVHLVNGKRDLLDTEQRQDAGGGASV